jgi:periplasmic divalent cation tolerance protein
MDAVVCLVTAPIGAARAIAEALVARELAACVNIVPLVHSVYRWQGEIEHDEESLLIVKTTSELVAAVDEALGELHPYETFELVALEVAAGAADYLEWIGRSVTRPAG